MQKLWTVHKLPFVCISINRLRKRRHPTWEPPKQWMMDSGAFTEVAIHGGFRHTPDEFVRDAKKWVNHGNCDIVVSQDWMCEPFVIQKTGLTVRKHQGLTIQRYDEICRLWDEDDAPIMPVLQGFEVKEYLNHLNQYGDRLKDGMRVGVGSVCKRQGNISLIEDILGSIKEVRPKLRLHGFGVKQTALKSLKIRKLLFSADSMAWSFAARYRPDAPKNAANDWREAAAFYTRITGKRIPLTSDGRKIRYLY